MVREFQSSGKTCIKYKGKKVCRWKAGSSPWDKKYQKGPKEDYVCDCSAPYGSYHDLGCDIEQCPICKDQLGFCEHQILFMTPDQRSKHKEDQKRKKFPSGTQNLLKVNRKW